MVFCLALIVPNSIRQQKYGSLRIIALNTNGWFGTNPLRGTVPITQNGTHGKAKPTKQSKDENEFKHDESAM
jgi:hypothetical protein